MTEMIITLVLLAIVSFVQNMFFTLVSRSRNSGDPGYHRYCAWGSNGVWFICQVMIVKNVWAAINEGNWGLAILAGLVYAICTTEGSVLMMKKLLKSEKGKRKVGATGGAADPEKLLARIAKLDSDLYELNDTMGGDEFDHPANVKERVRAMEETMDSARSFNEIDKYNAEVDAYNLEAEAHNDELDLKDEPEKG